MQTHVRTFIVKAAPSQVGYLVGAQIGVPAGTITEHGPVRIEIVHSGDDAGNGLVRHCWYPVPKYLLSGGKAESWELVTDIVPGTSVRYRFITTPPFAIGEGTQVLEDLGDGRTRYTFTETYRIEKRLLRFLERPVHGFISRLNDGMFEESIGPLLESIREGAPTSP